MIVGMPVDRRLGRVRLIQRFRPPLARKIAGFGVDNEVIR